MSRYSLEHLADDSLLDGLHSLVEHDRTTTADLLAHIGEVARRRLYAHLGYPSMQAYCVQVLHLSEDAARKRVQVARKGWLLPVIFEAIADGRVHLSGMKLLVPFIDEENVHELVEAASGRTYREIELLLAERFPQPEPDEGVEEVSGDAARHLRDRSGVKPIAPGRFREVWKRDQGRCAYVSPAGRRCESRWMLEFDHVHEFARGGEATVDNVRLLCRAHNQYLAECTFGAGFMDEKRGSGRGAATPAPGPHLTSASGGSRASPIPA